MLKLKIYLNILFICFISFFSYSQQVKLDPNTTVYLDYDGKVISSKLFNEKRRDSINYMDTFKMKIIDGKNHLSLVKKGSIIKTLNDKSVINNPQFSKFKIELTPQKVISFNWKTLIEDEQNDGRNPNFLDGKSLAYFIDQNSFLWFKLEYYELSKGNPAVSISLDTDNDQSNGVNWYGSNKNFKLDKMISVGPISKDNGHYVGYNGITDSNGIRTLDWINVSKNVVKFYHDKSNKTIYIGTNLNDLGLKKSQTIGLIGSVGTNAMWNDDIGDKGFIKIKIE